MWTDNMSKTGDATVSPAKGEDKTYAIILPRF